MRLLDSDQSIAPTVGGVPSSAAAGAVRDGDGHRDPGVITLTAVPPPFDRIDIWCGELPENTRIATARLAEEGWATPFQLPGWLEAWRRHTVPAADFVPVTAVAYAHNRPVLLLPLAQFQRFGARFLTWQAYRQSDYCAPVVDREFLGQIGGINGERLLQAIGDGVGGIDFIYIPKQPERLGPVRNPFILADSVGYHAGAHAINFRPGESWDSRLKRQRSAKTRRRLKDKRAALEKLGTVTFRIAAGPDEAKGIIESCLDTKSEQLARLGHWDPFAASGVRSFLTQFFADRAGGETWAASLDLDGRPLASAFGFAHRSDWLLYQTAMHAGPAARHSPGSHMLMHIMQHAAEIGLARLDLALGDESYKDEWCDEHLVLRMSVLALTVRGHLFKRLIVARAALREWIATRDHLYNAAKWAKGLATRFRVPV